jgi:ABC-type nitrate/sulfonate/bicarbonate transport system substrate-binding protein
MQRNLFVRADSSLTHPRDLVGKTVASRLPIDSGTGGGVLMMLEAAYGIDLHDIVWRTRAPDQPKNNRMGLRMEQGPDNEPELFEQLRRGEIAAVYVTTGPRYWSMFGGAGDKADEVVSPYKDLRPLITDPAVMADTYRRSGGLYPITDVGVMDAGLAARHPDAPAKVVDALAQANALSSKYRDAAEQKLAEREIELLGEDPHQYGLTANARKNLATVLDLFYHLGSIERKVEPEELFVPSVRG